MRELARIALLAEPALVVFTDQVADSAPFFFGDVVSVWTGGAAWAGAFDEVGADWAGYL